MKLMKAYEYKNHMTRDSATYRQYALVTIHNTIRRVYKCENPFTVIMVVAICL